MKIKNYKGIIFALVCGLLLGFCISLAIPDINNEYYSMEECNSFVTNGYNLGIVQTINYTQTTGMIKLINGDNLIDSNVCEYCEYIRALG